MRFSSPRQRRPQGNAKLTNVAILAVFAALAVGALQVWMRLSQSRYGTSSSVPTLPSPSQPLPSGSLIDGLTSGFSAPHSSGSGLIVFLVIIAGGMGLLYQYLQCQSPERLKRNQQRRLQRGRVGRRQSVEPHRNTRRKSREERHRDRIEQAVLARPEDPNTWIERGVMFENLRQQRDAIANYAEGLEHHPENGRLWFSHGLANAKAGNFRKALDSYTKALSYQPKDPKIWHAHGDALLELERFEEAIVSLETVLRHSPRFGHIWSDRGFALFQLGRYEAAANDLTEAVKSDPKDARSWFHLGEVQLILNQLDAALKTSDRGLKLHPNHEALMRQNQHIRARLGVL